MQVYISNKEIEQIAEGLVQVSCGESPPKYIDIDAIATYLGIISAMKPTRSLLMKRRSKECEAENLLETHSQARIGSPESTG